MDTIVGDAGDMSVLDSVSLQSNGDYYSGTSIIFPSLDPLSLTSLSVHYYTPVVECNATVCFTSASLTGMSHIFYLYIIFYIFISYLLLIYYLFITYLLLIY